MCAGLIFAPVDTLNTPDYDDNNILSALTNLGKAVPDEKQGDRIENEIQNFNELYPSRELTPVNNKFVIHQTKHVKVILLSFVPCLLSLH